MCVMGAKVGQGHPSDRMCNNSVRHKIYLVWTSYVNVHPRRDKWKLGQATFTDFHKVKVIFVAENANNTSKYTSLLGGFTVVVIAFEICIILDLAYNCVSQSQK